MLAQEAHRRLGERIGAENVGLVTGEERVNERAPVICSTVEMAPSAGELLVLDEVQWADDTERGSAWTRLLLAGEYREILLLGALDALPLVERAFPEAELRVFERKLPLEFVGARTLRSLGTGTVVVAFSRKAVLALAGEVNRLHPGRVAVLYGAMPLASRREEIERFLSGAADVCVATDVLGHGVNLPCETLLFAETTKFDGEERRDLRPWELAQIAGRAGRFGLVERGHVGVLAGLGWIGVDKKMTEFEALAYAFTTMSTGGFSTQARSLEAFSAAAQWIVVLFMLLAGTNFALMYRAFVRRKPVALVRDEEFRLYIGVLVLASAVLAAILWDAGISAGEEAIRQGAFQTVSIMTTTGFASTDFNTWVIAAPAAAMLIVALMFPGGSAGSTAGSIKIVRHLVIGRVLRRELDQAMHPEYVAPVRINRVAIDERTVRAVIAFVLLYVGIFVVGAVLLLLDAHRVDLELSPFDALAASATTLGNVGPAFGVAGPMGSFEPFSDVSIGIMTGLMWIGRLEIVPVVALLTRAYWRA